MQRIEQEEGERERGERGGYGEGGLIWQGEIFVIYIEFIITSK